MSGIKGFTTRNNVSEKIEVTRSLIEMTIGDTDSINVLSMLLVDAVLSHKDSDKVMEELLDGIAKDFVLTKMQKENHDVLHAGERIANYIVEVHAEEHPLYLVALTVVNFKDTLAAESSAEDLTDALKVLIVNSQQMVDEIGEELTVVDEFFEAKVQRRDRTKQQSKSYGEMVKNIVALANTPAPHGDAMQTENIDAKHFELLGEFKSKSEAYVPTVAGHNITAEIPQELDGEIYKLQMAAMAETLAAFS